MATTKQISTQISWRIIAVVMGVQILSIAIGIRLVLAHTNVLGNNANWIISKNELNFPGYDGSVFRDYPPAVAEEALNPAAWRGYHEVLSKDSFDWKEFSFKFQPSDHGYLYVIFDRSQDTFNALRFSFNPLYRPALIRAKYTGEFISQENLPSLPYTSALWQDFRLQRSETDLTTYTFLLNNQLVTTFKASASTKTSATQIGFREGQKPVLIDSVRVWGKNKQLLLADNFDHQENFWPYLGLASAALLAINRIIFLLLQSHYLVVKKYFQLLFVLSFFLLIFASVGLLLEKPLRTRYPDLNHWWFRLLNTPTNDASMHAIEKTEFLFTIYPLEKPPHTKRIIILGSSQIDGEGISRSGEDVSSQFQKLLDERLTTPTKKWQVIATGLSGEVATDLLESFKYQWLKFNPDLVIVNLSSNDSSYNQGEATESFKLALEEFIELSKIHHFILVFSAEANSIENNPKLKTHQVMQEIAKKNQVLFLHTHNYVATKTETGILWWDFVHLTSFGYYLISEYFFDQLEPILRKL